MQNGDFELGCNFGTSLYNSTASDTTLAANGTVGCRVCYTSGVYGFYTSFSVPLIVVPGETYDVVACVRSAPDQDAAAAITVFAQLAVADNGFPGAPVAVSASYVPARVSWNVMASYPSVELEVRSASEVPGTCFVVDDVRLLRVRDAGPG